MATLSEETRTRDDIVRAGQSIFDRGLTSGSTGNISVKMSDGRMLMTPTNASLGSLVPERLSLFSAEGVHLGGDKPTKEAFLHRCMYCARPHGKAVVHLHSTYSVAVSILKDIDEKDALPPLTAYYVMRVGTLPLVPYFRPGDEKLAAAVQEAAATSNAVLMANHGPVVAGRSLEEAQYATEELEETAKLFLTLQGRELRPLTPAQREELAKSI
ncbi:MULTISPECIES: 3-oxo-tetronate 4-phosphate decarboxylase [Sinorhizobium]|uniref:3-oxo-tetronate 4-phosphate decarboxylase n=1 Tax=Rhizobium fredii TaxID=380 RepID=A0A2L0HD64_RHIFR|nr:MULTISPECIES: 3-oxo-tetronate 4-phosphate decarboxylase [Sinorhizobium]AUX79405.1 class II aldolase/adducin domain-containing protein [Sinorhizobium fredii]WEJ08760.1 aldolase [Sinorhizobium sp. M103]WEJ14118.1 aldolase [Sinorhizobium sp. K101]